MATLVGTPPNIIISSFREKAMGEPFRMFDFAPVGVLVAFTGITFVALLGWKLIPKRDTKKLTSRDIDSYIAELTIPTKSALIGKRLAELNEAALLSDVSIIGMIRDGKRLYGSPQSAVLKAQDALILEAVPNAVDEFRSNLNLDFSDEKREGMLRAEGEGLSLSEVIVTDRSRLHGKSVQSVGLAWRYGTILMGVSRNGKNNPRTLAQTGSATGGYFASAVPQRKCAYCD